MLFYLKRKLTKAIITGAALSIIISMPVFAGAKAYSTGNSVNVRTAPNTSAEVIGSLANRQEINAIEVSNGFVKISYNGADGYVSGSFVEVFSADAVVTGINVNVRESIGGNVVGQLDDGESVTVTGDAGEFFRVNYNSAPAYVHKDFIDCEYTTYLLKVEAPVKEPEPTYAVVISNTVLNLRSKPSTGSSILAKLQVGEILDVEENGAEWIKVKTNDGITGYVSAEFVSLKTGPKPERPSPSSKGAEVVAYAKQFLGTRYVYGGTNLRTGVDCSGFIYSVYKHFGITLNRTSASMPANGTKVSKSELVAGDLVFFTNNGAKNIQHVGMYCGDGTFIHSASGKAMRVMISGLNESYYVKNYITAVRVLR